MGTKNSMFGQVVDKANQNNDEIPEEKLHENSTISSVEPKKKRSRTNVLSKAVNAKKTITEDGYIDNLDPRICQTWKRQSRFFNLLDEKQCDDLISDFKSHIGQKIPIVIREIPKDIQKQNPSIKYEVVAGSRRLWSALYVVNNFNEEFRLKAIIKELDDKQASIECEKENDREELSAFERGMYYHRLLKEGVFEQQKQLSDSLNIPPATLNELLEFGRIHKNIVDIFEDPREIKKLWAKSLNQLAKNKVAEKAILKKVKEIANSSLEYTSQKIFTLLKKAGVDAVQVPSSNKVEEIKKEIKDPKTKRPVVNFERTKTNKFRINIDNKHNLSREEIISGIDKFLNDCGME